ncbi:MAG: tetratricopeptide repeat protein [Flavobacteriales bacterium]|nr:tetratricopeptide repeat protein [Flavobacteriales bacterium]
MKRIDFDSQVEKVRKSPSFLKSLVFDYLEHTSGGEYMDYGKYLGRITKLCEQLQDENDEAKTLKTLLLGIDLYLTDNYNEASACLLSLLKKCDDLDDLNIQGLCRFFYGKNLLAMGDQELALAEFIIAEEFLKYSDPVPTYYELLMCNLGQVSTGFGQYDDALDYFEKGLSDSYYNERKNGRFELYCGLSTLFRLQNNWGESRRFLDEALISSATPTQRSRALHDLGITLLELGSLDDALSCVKMSHNIRAKSKQQDAISSKILIGKIYLALKDYTMAISILKETLSITVLFKSSLNEKEIQICLDRAYSAIKKNNYLEITAEEQEKIKSN